MVDILDTLALATTDAILFPASQVLLVLFAVYAKIKHVLLHRSESRSMMNVEIIRADGSMARFYATFALLNGIFISLCLSVDAAEPRRILFVTLDTFAIWHLCMLNSWFRNKLMSWHAAMTKVEVRR
tara:strand:- start:22 stop:402 length:381 start_codon:yes stop_codon:yes gene_type:complete